VRIVEPLVVAGLALAALGAGAAQPLAAQSTGVFTAAQAAQGATIYAAQCSMCHGDKLEGGVGPQLAGSDFIAKWTGQTADDVHDVVANQMPQSNPGSLTPAQALAVTAYILQQNKYPAGSTPLDAASLKGVKIAKQ
jgi:mono/diheme cytochrome c family protein